jgi:pimeloyl-ACP methyl ester carboxylesterase
MSHRETTETVAGCSIRMMRKGDGAPLLFLHGLTGLGGWQPFMDALAAEYDTIVPEHPGFGQSDTPDWLDSTGDLAYFYLDLIGALGLGPVHVVGASLGGWIAAEMAVRDPGAFRSLTLVSPAGIHFRGVRRNDIFLWSPEETVRNLFHDPALAGAAPDAANDADLEVSLKNRSTLARVGWNPRMHNPDLPKWLHRVAVPTLILWGAEDRVLPPEYGPAYRDLIPSARLEVIRDCGHLPHVEKPEAFSRTTLDFLRGAA